MLRDGIIDDISTNNGISISLVYYYHF